MHVTQLVLGLVLLVGATLCGVVESLTTASCKANDTMSPRVAKALAEIFPAPRPHWVGDGFHVFPVFGSRAFTKTVSPFLMFDYAAPKRFEPTSRQLGVGTHPHRGFETVTVCFDGEVEHGDSVGNRGVMRAGDVQWMTAGRGIVHEEFHSRSFAKRGGLLSMCQLWVNLPRKHKMTAPRYQPITADQIPSVDVPGGRVRVIAGELQGVAGPARTFSPITLFHGIIDDEGSVVDLESPEGHNALLFVAKGELLVDGTRLVASQVSVLDASSGDTVRFTTAARHTEIVLMGGLPIDEPIAARGPFVMNTQAEIAQANADYRGGRFA